MGNDDENDVPKTKSTDRSDSDTCWLSDQLLLYRSRIIGSHSNVFEGEVRSSVYRVRPCVIKFATINEQNIKESKILTKLGHHTNVIAIIQSGTYHDLFGDRVYIALDKCHNENLRQYLANRTKEGIEFHIDQAIDFAKQIIAGVTYIHDNNVIHLDLKPSNILISQNLRLIKIADFGLSIVVKSPKSKVFHKRQFGTNGYRPVESFGNSVVSRRTDIFSLGTVLFHLLSNGNELFGCDEHIFIYNVTNDVTHLSGLLVKNPSTTEHLIKRMVSKERCRRPTIWEVSDHPCWSGKEVFCLHIEYFGDDEIDDDDVTIDKIFDEGRAAVSPTDHESEKEFLKKMRDKGYDRQPTVILFDIESRHMFRFDHRNKSSMTKMQAFPEDHFHENFKVISLSEYVYIFSPSYAVYRLEYGDVEASWERMSDWNKAHGNAVPDVVASSEAIFLVGAGHQFSKAVSKYVPRVDHHERLADKPTSTQWSALLCNDDFLYCIGGHKPQQPRANIVERMDLRTMKWERVANMNHEGRFRAFCVEYRGNIYVAGDVTHSTQSKSSSSKGRGWSVYADSYLTRSHTNLEMEMYDPKVDQWTELNFINVAYASVIRRVLLIDESILAIDNRRLYKYDFKRDEWSIFTTFEDMNLADATLVNMSR